jgi:hypothetical protein
MPWKRRVSPWRTSGGLFDLPSERVATIIATDHGGFTRRDHALSAAANLARARSIPEAWPQIIAFYEGLISEHSLDCLAPLLRLVRQIALTERTRSFRPDPSLWRLIISMGTRRG